MIDFIQNFNPVMQALIATIFTWSMTAFGAATVFTSKDINRRMLDGMLGFAAGVMIAANFPSATFAGAMALALCIGIQNFPEGLAVSMSLRREGMSRLRSFWYWQLSAVVEPIAAVIVAIAVIDAKTLLPYALGFAAEAMIFVVVEEVIPESQRNGNTDFATAGAMIGFAIMMVLDVAFS